MDTVLMPNVVRRSPFRFVLFALVITLILTGFSGPQPPTHLPTLGGGTGSAIPADANGFTLTFPTLDLTVPVREALIVEDTWDFSSFTQDAGHFELTAYPGQGSNVVIGAHYELAGFQPGPFLNLDSLPVGDRILVNYRGRVYTYVITQTLLVDPSNIEIVFGTPQETLTLLTCYDYTVSAGTYTRRYVVRAVLESVS